MPQENGRCPSCRHVLIEKGTRPELAIIYVERHPLEPRKFRVRVTMGHIGFSRQGKGGRGHITSVRAADGLDVERSHVVAVVHPSCVDNARIEKLGLVIMTNKMTIGDVRREAQRSVKGVLLVAGIAA